MVSVTVERGVVKQYNKFYIQKTIDGKQRKVPFDTLEEARDAHQAYLEDRAEADAAARANARANAPVNPNREANIARNGRNRSQERDFINDVFKREAEAQGFDIHVLNDGTRSDVAIRRRGWQRYLPIQVKTTQGAISGNERSYEFQDTKGYGGMPVLCWVVEEQRGWVFCGDWLNKRKANKLSVTPNPLKPNSRAALPHALSKTPRGIKRLVRWFGKQLERKLAKYPRRTKRFLSWEFGGDVFTNAKERLAIHNYQKHIDQKASFPEEQQGSYDLLDCGGMRQQHKVASYVASQAGLDLSFSESAGMVNDRQTRRPYPEDAFDELVVAFLAPPNVHFWTLSEAVLEDCECFRTATSPGKTGIKVYLPGTGDNAPEWGFTQSWSHYTGCFPLDIPDVAYEASPHLFNVLYPRASALGKRKARSD